MNQEKNVGNCSVFAAGTLESLADRDFHGITGKLFLGEELGLTGCEVSLNRVPAGGAVPFVHTHKRNEELYIVLRGQGAFHVDGEEFPVQEGSCVRIAPEGKRAWRAGDSDLYFLCVQTEQGSLRQATLHDEVIVPDKTTWMA